MLVQEGEQQMSVGEPIKNGSSRPFHLLATWLLHVPFFSHYDSYHDTGTYFALVWGSVLGSV